MIMQQNPLAADGPLAHSQTSPIRLLLNILSLFCLTEIVLVIVPFFANGIHLADANQVYLGYYDPKGYFPYSASGLLLVAISLVHTLRLLTIPFIGLVSVLMMQRSQYLDRRLLVTYVLVVAVAALIIGFFSTATGNLATLWLYD